MPPGCASYDCPLDEQSIPACASIIADGPRLLPSSGLLGLPPCEDAFLGSSPPRIHMVNETAPLEGQAPATVWLDVRKPGVGPRFRPHGSIVMVVHNAARALNWSLPLLFQLTESCSELLVLLDQCTDSNFLYSPLFVRNWTASERNWSASLETVVSRLDGFLASRFKRVRVLLQQTPIWESAGENILMSISDPLKYYVSVQPDNLVQEVAWDLQLSRPLDSFNDVFSVSGMLAHALGTRTPTTRFLKNRPMIRDPVLSTAPRAASLQDRDHYYVRDTSSRGPLLFHAQRIQQLGFFDHELYYLEDSDHDIHCRALVLHNWSTGVVALRQKESNALKTKRNGENVATNAAKDESRHVLSRIKAREKIVRAKGRRGCLHEQEKILKQMPPRAETRPLSTPAPNYLCASSSGSRAAHDASMLDDATTSGSVEVHDMVESRASSRVAIGATDMSDVTEWAARAQREADARVEELRLALGPYRFYVYEGTAFDGMSSALPLPEYNVTYVGIPGVGVENTSRTYSGIFAEYTAPVWVHRALLDDPMRTSNPDEADLFFVPLYMAISESQPSHKERLNDWMAALRQSWHYKRKNGADHIIAPQAISKEMPVSSGLSHVRELLRLGFTGAFEMNAAWTSGWERSRTIVMPYVANPYLTSIEVADTSAQDYIGRDRNTSFYYFASLRDWSIGRAGCQRAKLRPLENYPNASVKIAKRSQHLVPQDEYALAIRRGEFCPLTCGDTPTSRRTFDAFVAGCVPLIVGTRLFGLCEPPCHKGWFDVVGSEFPHLPFADLWMNWSIFPTVNEQQVYDQKSNQGVRDLFSAAVVGFGGKSGALKARAHMYARRSYLVYGWGDYRNSKRFGNASRLMIEAALWKLRGRSIGKNGI